MRKRQNLTDPKYIPRGVWLGRNWEKPVTNSFQHFLQQAKRSQQGRDHLKRHHGGQR